MIFACDLYYIMNDTRDTHAHIVFSSANTQEVENHLSRKRGNGKIESKMQKRSFGWKR